jgi:hypothetical protein
MGKLANLISHKMKVSRHDVPTQIIMMIEADCQVLGCDAANAKGKRTNVKPAVRRTIPGMSSSTNKCDPSSPHVIFRHFFSSTSPRLSAFLAFHHRIDSKGTAQIGRSIAKVA